MTTKITIVRHGETEWNKEGRMQGQSNSPLSCDGVSQAKYVAKALEKRKFNILISSDLGRAIQTTDIINQVLNIKVIINSNLRERSFGIMEGNNFDEIKQKYPDIYDGYKSKDSEYIIPKGESFKQFYIRVISEIKNIAKKYNGKHVLIVSHGCVLECILYQIFNLNLNTKRAFSINNTAINTFEIDNNKWFLHEWGVIEHII